MTVSRGAPPELTVLIADDEALARRRVIELLDACESVRIAGQSASGPQTVAAVRRLEPDLLFLDVQMPGMNGFEVLAELEPEERPVVVFCTAYDEYAIDAFEVNAIDYLLKPYADERFHESLARARTALERSEEGRLRDRLQHLLEGLPGQASATRPPPRTTYLERFAVPVRGRWMVVPAGSVDWIEASGDYVTLHVGQETYLVRGTMAAMHDRLDPSRFLRIHRSAIVNMDRVRAVHAGHHGDYSLELDGGVRRRISRSYRDVVLDRLGLRG